jgi:hypothetical protein
MPPRFFLLPYPSAAPPPPPPLIFFSTCLGPRGTPSPPCEGDCGRNDQISPCGPPSSPLSLFFFFCPVRSGLVQVGFAGAQGWLVTLAGYLFFDGKIESYCRGCDLQRPWMLRRQRVWGLLPYRAFIISLDLRVDLSKLLLVESPKTRIA